MWPPDTGSTRKCLWTRARCPRPLCLEQGTGRQQVLLPQLHAQGEPGHVRAPAPRTRPCRRSCFSCLASPHNPGSSCCGALRPRPPTWHSLPPIGGFKHKGQDRTLRAHFCQCGKKKKEREKKKGRDRYNQAPPCPGSGGGSPGSCYRWDPGGWAARHPCGG